MLGAGLGWLAVLLVPLLLVPSLPAWLALAVWLTGLGSLTIVARGIGLGWHRGAGEQREDANLVARRSGDTPRRWLVAHVDTKAQGHSMAGRLVAVWVVLAAVLAMTGLAAARLAALPRPAFVAGAAGLVLAAGILAGRGRLRGATRGARDNGSGLVAVLAAAARAGPGTGVILTGAEEFGLVGARILAEGAPELVRGTDVINVDTVDDRGTLAVVAHDAAGAALAAELLPRLSRLAPRVRLRRLPLGIFVDSAPLARAGARAVTIGRLDWGTLRVIHTARDTREGLSFGTAEGVGERLGRLA